MRELNDIHVTWQMTVVICGLIVFGGACAVPVGVFLESGWAGMGKVPWVCGAVGGLSLLLIYVAVRSRLRQLDEPDDRSAVISQLVRGTGLIAAAVALTLVSMAFGSFAGLGESFYLAPTGLYALGLFVIATALLREAED